MWRIVREGLKPILCFDGRWLGTNECDGFDGLKMMAKVLF
jgi:hypothetical protein